MAVQVLEFLEDNTKGKPNEDFLYSLSDRVFAVADGLTRFVSQGKDYPNPSPAGAAAEFFSEVAAMSIEGLIRLGQLTADRTEEAIREAFSDANTAIRRLNESNSITKETTDYLENDFASCVGALGMLVKSTLYHGYIGDCGLLVYDSKSSMPKFMTANDMALLEDFREAWGWFKEMSGVDMAEEKIARRLFWAKDLRNKPGSPCLTYGALTGEREALAYMKIGKIELGVGDTAIFFSDGILPYLFARSVREAIVQGLESDMGEAVKKEIVAQAISRSNFTLRMQNFKNLNDDKAFIAFQLV